MYNTERRHWASGLLAAVVLSALLAVAIACASAQEPSAPQQPAAPAPAAPAAAAQQPSGMAPQAPQQPAAPAPAAAAQPAAASIPEAAPIGSPKVTKTRRVMPAMDEQMIQRGGTLQWVPQASLRTLDPVWTTAAMTHNTARQIYDAVFAWDSALQSQPQLIEEWSMTDDAKSYTFKIREGLTFHDGDTQTTDDVLASIARYEQRQPIGISIRQLGEPSYKKIDDVTFQMDMGKTFGLVPFFWGTWGTVYIFKEEVANGTLPDVAIEAEQTIGSGPFKFVSWEPGNRLVMERHEDYIPRTDPKDGASGRKEAFLDRIVMAEVPDQATRVAALLTQQADFSEGISGDLLPTLEDSSVQVDTISPWASPWLVFNHLHPPFNDQRARLAVQSVVDRAEYMRAGYGPEFLWETCAALFMCGGPLASEAGSDIYYAEPNVELGKQLWQEYVSDTGFDDPVIVLAATDYPDFFASGLITKRNLESIGAKVEMPSMDWAAVVARRAEKSLPGDGGWNVFHTWGGTFDPITAVGLSGNWFGWPQNDTIQGLIEEFPLAGTLEEQLRIADAIQQENYENPNYLTMGQFNFLVARQDYVKGYEPHRLLHFWGVWLDK